MKRIICTKLIALMCMCLALNSCDNYTIVITMLSSHADLIVANITTGEQTGSSQGTGRITAHPGDVLRISYNEPDDYEEYRWEVTINIFGEEITEEAPFVTEYTVREIDEGQQTITCRGVINDSDVDSFAGADTGTIYVDVVNE